MFTLSPSPMTQNEPSTKSAAIFDVTTVDFEYKVMRASMETPVLVDFWAPWCGPCKQLMPVLESAVTAAGDKVKLAKINIDDNPELAQALRIQSVPTVFAFFKGQPVTAFNGVRPASEIKSLIDQLIKMAQGAQPDALDIPATLTAAAQALAAGDAAGAQELYMAVIAQDENNGAAYAGLVRTFIAADLLDAAQQVIEQAPEALAKDSHLAAARGALDLAKNLPAGNEVHLRATIEKNPVDFQSHFDLALILFSTGKRGEAVDHLIEIVRRNRTWEEEKARHQLLKFFDAMGPSDPETLAGRRKLSSVLFS